MMDDTFTEQATIELGHRTTSCPECYADPVPLRIVTVPGVMKFLIFTCTVCEWSTVDDWERLDIEYKDIPLSE